jgi:hypothetical protein
LRPLRRTEAPRDLLFDLDHPHIALGPISFGTFIE